MEEFKDPVKEAADDVEELRIRSLSIQEPPRIEMFGEEIKPDHPWFKILSGGK